MADEPKWVDISGLYHGVRVVVKTLRYIVRNPLEWSKIPIPPGTVLKWQIRNEDLNHLRVSYEENPNTPNPQFFTIMAQGLPRSEVAETWLPQYIWVQDVTGAVTHNVYLEFIQPADERADAFQQYAQGDLLDEGTP
jgi:hypothetical protein